MSGTEIPLHVFGGSDGYDLRGDLIRERSWLRIWHRVLRGRFRSGVVFKLDPSGNETTLYNFSGGVDGANPQSGLLEDAAGNLYGTTWTVERTASVWFSSSIRAGMRAYFTLSQAAGRSKSIRWFGSGRRGQPVRHYLWRRCVGTWHCFRDYI